MNSPVAHRPQHHDLVRNMLQFGRLLRSYELLVTPSEIFDGLRALESVDLNDRAEVHLAMRTTLTSKLEDLPIFDQLFESFWRSLVSEQEIGGRKRFKGEVAEARDDALALRLADGDVEIPYSAIVRGNLIDEGR